MDGCQQQPGLAKALGLTSLPLSSSRVPAVSQSSLLFKPWAAGLTLWTPPSPPGLSEANSQDGRKPNRGELQFSEQPGFYREALGQPAIEGARMEPCPRFFSSDITQKSPHIPTCSPDQSKSPLVSLVNIGLALTVCARACVSCAFPPVSSSRVGSWNLYRMVAEVSSVPPTCCVAQDLLYCFSEPLCSSER
jgi:hypothetical protein